MSKKQQVVIYQTKDGSTPLEIQLGQETLWLTQSQIADVFGTQRPAITKHFSNMFKNKELDLDSVSSILEHTAKDGKQYKTRFYNLDAVLSVGYRVNSKQATQFRLWASQVLKDYLVKGFAVNEKRLKEKTRQLEELKKVIQLQEKVSSNYPLQTNEAGGLLQIIAAYSNALELLDDYDHQRLKLPKIRSKTVHKITYNEAKKAIHKLGEQTGASSLFGKEKDDSFKGSLENIYQTFDGKELYSSVEEKAAHLLYFIVKNHSFTDGNKRIAAFPFIWFLKLNKLLYDEQRTKCIDDNALVALTLMIAESNPNDKDMMIKVVVNLIHKK